jgi:hypothetical protein
LTGKEEASGKAKHWPPNAVAYLYEGLENWPKGVMIYENKNNHELSL